MNRSSNIEVEFIDKVFYYLDETFPDCNDMETNILIKKVYTTSLLLFSCKKNNEENSITEFNV